MSPLFGDTEYQIETKISAGKIEDPVTGETHEIDPFEDKRGGTITVDRPDSAKYIVDTASRRSFVDKAPTAEAVKEAQRETFDFAGSPVCESFASTRGDTLGSQDLSPSAGFDPESDAPRNDYKIKVLETYEALQSGGYDDEAAYLRSLPSLDKQERFVSHVREHEEVSL